MTSIEAAIIPHHFRWAGHIHRLDSFSLSKKMFYGELTNRTKPQEENHSARHFQERMKRKDIEEEERREQPHN